MSDPIPTGIEPIRAVRAWRAAGSAAPGLLAIPGANTYR